MLSTTLKFYFDLRIKKLLKKLKYSLDIDYLPVKYIAIDPALFKIAPEAEILFSLSANYFPPMVETLMIKLSCCSSYPTSFLRFFSKYIEERADKLGVSICSDAAKKAAPQFFEEIRTAQIKKRNKTRGSYSLNLWRRLLITENGESRFDVFTLR